MERSVVSYLSNSRTMRLLTYIGVALAGATCGRFCGVDACIFVRVVRLRWLNIVLQLDIVLVIKRSNGVCEKVGV